MYNDLETEVANRFIDWINWPSKAGLIGRRDEAEIAILSVLMGSHCLFEGQPGTGKTELAKLLAAAVNQKMSRIQGTPDLRPSGIRGITMVDPSTNRLVFEKGPIHNVLITLFDEMNRTMGQAGAALLDAMQDRTVTERGTTYRLPDEWAVFATQNPSGSEGTRLLEPVQLDRFGLSVQFRELRGTDYVNYLREVDCVQRGVKGANQPKLDLESGTICIAQKLVRSITVPDGRGSIYALIEHIIDETFHGPSSGLTGFVGRSGIALMSAAKAKAFLRKEREVSRDDVFKMMVPALLHRVRLADRRVIDPYQERQEAEDRLIELRNKLAA